MRIILALALLLAACSRPPAPPPTPPTGPWRPEILDLVNARRHPRPPLTMTPALNQASQEHSREMAARGLLFHAAGVNEVVGEGHRTPEEIVDGWMASPGHRAVLLGRWTTCGFGRARASGGTLYWTGRFE